MNLAEPPSPVVVEVTSAGAEDGESDWRRFVVLVAADMEGEEPSKPETVPVPLPLGNPGSDVRLFVKPPRQFAVVELDVGRTTQRARQRRTGAK